MEGVAVKSGLSDSLVWKLEHDRRVRWETIHIVLTKAFHLKPSSDEYQRFHDLWIKDRMEKAETMPPDSNKLKLSKHAVEVTRKFRNLVRDLNKADAKKVLAAAERAASRLT